MDQTLEANTPSLAPDLGGGEAAPTATERPSAPEAPSLGIHEMSKEERKDFLRTGKHPDRDTTSSDGSADSSSAPAEGKKAAETAARTKAASEPAVPAKDKPKARNSEENRVAELLEERRRERDRADREARRADELERRIAALEKPKTDAKQDSSPTAGKPKVSFKDLRDKGAPDINEFDDPNEWAAALTDFSLRQAREELAQRERQQHEAAEIAQYADRIINTAGDRLEADEKSHPELKERVHPALKAIVPSRLLPKGEAEGPHHFAKDCITFESDHPLQLSAFYSTPEGQAEWDTFKGMEKRQIERAIARRDLMLGTTSAGSAGAEAKPAAVKTFTKTPPPPAKAGPKGAVVADKAASAVQSGDFASFREELDAREGVQRQFGRRRSA